jgi:hypothetical protein
MSIIEVNIVGFHFTRAVPELRRILRLHPRAMHWRSSEVRHAA